MSFLPSAHSELRKTLADSLLVRHISTPMELRRSDQQASEVMAYLQQRNFDVMGLLEVDRISRYIARKFMTDKGVCGDYARPIEPTEIVSSTTALIEFLPLMKDRHYVFVLESTRLDSIVTHADLQKPPVRMLLFSLISLLDMFLLILVRKHYPGESFCAELKPKRVEKGQELLNLRRQRNEEIDLADCLQFCDKRALILKAQVHKDLGFESEEVADRFLKDAEKLRDRLAHSQDLVLGTSWTEVIDLAVKIDEFLRENEGKVVAWAAESR